MNEPQRYKGQDDSDDAGQAHGGRRRRKKHSALHRALNITLIVLLAAAATLGGMLYQAVRGSGAIESLPIVTAPAASPSAAPTPPADLAPAQEDTDDGPLPTSVPDNGRTPIYAVPAQDPDVLNILVLGLDTRERGGSGRSDVNMIVSIRRTDGRVRLASLLRDTLVPIEGHGWNRLNSAYLFGGPGKSINTVNGVYGTDIQRYVKLDFFAISDIIDAVGGVQVELTKAEVDWLRDDGINIPAGAGAKQLDGAKALAYARIRKLDSDFQRTQRQRNVMKAALKNLQGMGAVQSVALMRKLLGQVRTNIGAAELFSLAATVVSARGQQITELTVPVKGSYSFKSYKGMSILSVNFEKNTGALKDFLYTP